MKLDVKVWKLRIFFINKDLIADTWTPMNADQSVNYDAIPYYGKILLLQGVKNVYINGTTGEGMSLSVEERQKCAEKWIKAGMDVVVNHVGAKSIADVKALGTLSEKQLEITEYLSLISYQLWCSPKFFTNHFSFAFWKNRLPRNCVSAANFLQEKSRRFSRILLGNLLCCSKHAIIVWSFCRQKWNELWCDNTARKNEETSSYFCGNQVHG